MIRVWRGVNSWRWYVRWPTKWAFAGLVCALVLFPNPWRLARHVERWQNPNRLIDPDAPALRPMVAELSEQLDPSGPAKETLAAVEAFVIERIPYAWDWETWGVADYVPSVEETLAAGREDCDGRAVIAASLLRNFGFEADLTSDFTHVWVKTEHGETMGPGRRKSVIASDREGLQVRWETIANLPRALAFGTAVFPLGRELILLGVLWLVLLRPGVSWRDAALSGFLLIGALFAMRYASRAPYAAVGWLQWTGLLSAVAAVVVLVCRRPRVREVRMEPKPRRPLRS